MKIGSVAWGWTPVPEDMPSGDSLEIIAKKVKGLGFDFIDYLCDRKSLDGYFTESVCERIKNTVSGLGMWVNGLAFQSDEWNNPDEKASALQFDYLEKILKTAGYLGAKTISCIIPGPFGAKPSPRPSPSDKIASNLPSDYSWLKDWELFAGHMKKAAKLAAGHDIRIALECFPRSLCSTPDAMLSLLRAVDEKNFGIQLDTAHLMNQNIDIETAVFMLGGRNIFHVHAKDSDAMVRSNLAPGCGLVDYTAFFKALAAAGYTGHVSVEVEFTADPGQYMEMGLAHVRRCLKEAGMANLG